MASKVGHQIERLRYKLGLSQTGFGKLFNTTAMSVSRWERDANLPDSRALLKLGVMAKQQRMDGWMFWECAGLYRADARAALAEIQVQAAAAGRR